MTVNSAHITINCASKVNLKVQLSDELVPFVELLVEPRDGLLALSDLYMSMRKLCIVY